MQTRADPADKAVIIAALFYWKCIDLRNRVFMHMLYKLSNRLIWLPDLKEQISGKHLVFSALLPDTYLEQTECSTSLSNKQYAALHSRTISMQHFTLEQSMCSS